MPIPTNAICGLVLALGLAGCATPGGGVRAPTDQEVGTVISQVQGLTRQICGFVPIAATLTDMFTAGAYSSVFEIANTICRAVTAAPPRARRDGIVTVRVNGVVIQGRRV